MAMRIIFGGIHVVAASITFGAFCLITQGVVVGQVNAPLPVTHVVDVQLVQVSTTDGTEVASVFGNATQREAIENRVNEIWSQCGIRVNFLSTINSYANDFAFDGRPTDYSTTARPESHLGFILSAGNSAGVANSNSNAVAAYFVGISPGHADLRDNPPDLFAAGLANVDRNGLSLFVDELLPTFPAGLAVTAQVFAHELGHNLGLTHLPVGAANLLSEAAATTQQLDSGQCSTVFTNNGGRDGFELLQASTFAPCDFDGDGQCDLDDLDYVYDGFGSSNATLNLDNSDGLNTVDELDLSAWLLEASDVSNPYKSDPNDVYVIGDTNLDGQVDSQDLGMLLNFFSDGSGRGWESGNLNSDASIDSTDLGLLLNNFGHGIVASAAVVPEPSNRLLMLGAFVLLIVGRTRRSQSAVIQTRRASE